MGKYIELNSSNIEDTIKEGLALVYFWAPWCGPCRMIAPLIEEMHNEYGDKAVIGKVDVYSNNSIAVKYWIRNIPTILFLKDGEVVDKVVGAVPKATLTAKLDALL